MITNNRKQWLKTTIVAFSLMFIAVGCGSGGGGDTVAQNDTSVSTPDTGCENARVANHADLNRTTSFLNARTTALEEGSAKVIVQFALGSSSSRSSFKTSAPCSPTPDGPVVDTTVPSAPEPDTSAIEDTQNTILETVSEDVVGNVIQYENLPFMAMEVDSAALSKLENNPLVISIEEDIKVEAFLAESGPLIGATAANSSGYTGAGQTVAVLDTGVQYDHPFLTGRVVYEACFTTDLDCPTGNVGSTGTGAAADGHGHGTHVAGIVAGAAGVNGALVGVAPSANIIGVKVLQDSGSGSYSGIIAGLDHVYSLRNTYSIAAVNMSLGGGSSASECDASYPAMTTAINNLASAGIATVIASGNDWYTDRISFPGCISTAVSVGSTCDSVGGSYCPSVEAVAPYSNSASFLDILAPGSYITSSTKNSGWGYGWSGTSMATPQVAGAWAVIKGSGAASSVTGVLGLLQSTGVSVTDSRNGVTKSRIQVDAALGAGSLPSLAPVQLAPAGVYTSNQLTFSWNSVSGATSYRLLIQSSSGTVYDVIVAAVGNCVSGVCSTNPGPLSSGLLGWWVRGINGLGNGPWSSGVAVDVSTGLPGQPEGTSPVGFITISTPAYSWPNLLNATSYQLVVQGPSGTVINQTYPAASICTGGVCSVTSSSLTSGLYGWWIRGNNSSGWGPWGTGISFDVSVSGGLPLQPSQIAPAGKNIVSNTTYRWSDDGLTTQYQLVVQGSSGTVINQTYSASTYCSAGACSITPSTLAGGLYGWWVRGTNAIGTGTWSDGASFEVPSSSTPGKPTGLSPTGVSSNATPVYSLTDDGVATQYQLVVQGPSGTVINMVFSASSYCSAGVCSISPSTLGSGLYGWWARGSNGSSYGPWTDGIAFQVNGVAGGAGAWDMPENPVGISDAISLSKPLGLAPVGTNVSSSPTYVWIDDGIATQYQLLVHGPNGTVIDETYDASTYCSDGRCSVTHSILPDGLYGWWVAGSNGSDIGSLSEGLAFQIPEPVAGSDAGAWGAADMPDGIF